MKEKEKVVSLFNIYPNPATSLLTVATNSCVGNEVFLDIFDMNGKQIIGEMLLDRGKNVIDISDFTKGIYVVKIRTTSEIESRKLVVQ